MSSRVRCSAVLAVVAIAGVLAGVNGLTDRERDASADQSALEPATRAETPLAPGWRWEAYHDVQVQVPDTWARSLWAGPPKCTEYKSEPEPIVRRPGGAVVTMVVPCPAPGAAIRHVAPSLEFAGERPEVIRYADGWTKETRRIGSLLITVTTGEDALREQIFASAGVIPEIDGNGCEPAPALARDEVVRPPSQGGLKSVGPVHSVSVCRYSTWTSPTAPWPMQASSRITGRAAQQLVVDLVAAPAGTGPTVTEPRICGPDPGAEVVILRVDGSAHDQDVIYRYDGCKHNGTDDGTILRKLTTATAKRVFTGAHDLDEINNVQHQLLIGPPAPVR
jgi:hypothetical protein